MEGELTSKQTFFVKEYLLDLNATQAAIRAGYSPKTATKIASKLLTKADIQDAIQDAMTDRGSKTDITAEYVLETIKDTVERCRQVKPVTDKAGKAVLVEDLDGAIVPAYSFDPGNVLRGCELLGKHLVLFVDKAEVKHSGEIGTPELNIIVNGVAGGSNTTPTTV